MPVSDYTPTVAQVGALLRARTKDTGGNELGTFTSATRPTDTEVNLLIAQAAGTLSTKAGDDIPAALFDEASQLAAIRAAMLVELSYFPEQIMTGRSTYPQLQELWIEGFGSEDGKKKGSLIQAITSAESSGGQVLPEEPGMVQYTFPPSSGIGSRRL